MMATLRQHPSAIAAAKPEAYADQAEQDHAALKAAVRAGIIDVELEQ
jgi:hypothetical protein